MPESSPDHHPSPPPAVAAPRSRHRPSPPRSHRRPPSAHAAISSHRPCFLPPLSSSSLPTGATTNLLPHGRLSHAAHRPIVDLPSPPSPSSSSAHPATVIFSPLPSKSHGCRPPPRRTETKPPCWPTGTLDPSWPPILPSSSLPVPATADALHCCRFLSIIEHPKWPSEKLNWSPACSQLIRAAIPDIIFSTTGCHPPATFPRSLVPSHHPPSMLAIGPTITFFSCYPKLSLPPS